MNAVKGSKRRVSGEMTDAQLHDLMSHHGLVDDVYRAMKHCDMSQVVMAATDALKRILVIPTTSRESKSESISTRFRNKGNKFFKSKKYRSALQCYNEALKYAPNNSNAMVFAYSNRSAVLLNVMAFTACLKDIQTCLDMNCSKDINEKLKKRQSECFKHIGQEALRQTILFRDEFVNNFFKFNIKHNPKIPCVSSDVDVVFNQSGGTKVIALNSIQVGTVVALEEAFVGALTIENNSTSCYYCHKMTYNLRPCNGCCAALFCDSDCKERCTKDYHRIECQIVDSLGSTYVNPICKLITRAVIKISLECESWQEFISASLNIGASRMKNGTINDMFDVRNKFSILNFDDDKQFIHGKIYKGSFICAILLDCFSRVRNYIPQTSKERDAAMRALGRTMMHLYVSFTKKIDICSFAHDYWGDKSLAQTNCGWFSFTSKLKHSCEPNLLVAGLNNKVALVALRPIERGEELNISYIPHWCDKTVQYERSINTRQKHLRRVLSLFAATQLTCTCRVCVGQCNVSSAKETHSLTEKQKRYCQNLVGLSNSNKDLQFPFKMACKAMHSLRGLENTKQYCQAFEMFIVHLHYYQFIATHNVSISEE